MIDRGVTRNFHAEEKKFRFMYAKFMSKVTECYTLGLWSEIRAKVPSDLCNDMK